MPSGLKQKSQHMSQGHASGSANDISLLAKRVSPWWPRRPTNSRQNPWYLQYALPSGGLEILVDSTQDTFGARVWTRAICRNFTEDQEFGFSEVDCDEGS